MIRSSRRGRGKFRTGSRCLVCQNQSIDDSDAPLARDLRLLVRERLKSGDSDAQVTDFIVARYGEFVLLKPPLTWAHGSAHGRRRSCFCGGDGCDLAQHQAEPRQLGRTASGFFDDERRSRRPSSSAQGALPRVSWCEPSCWSDPGAGLSSPLAAITGRDLGSGGSAAQLLRGLSPGRAARARSFQLPNAGGVHRHRRVETGIMTKLPRGVSAAGAGPHASPGCRRARKRRACREWPPSYTPVLATAFALIAMHDLAILQQNLRLNVEFRH